VVRPTTYWHAKLPSETAMKKITRPVRSKRSAGSASPLMICTDVARIPDSSVARKTVARELKMEIRHAPMVWRSVRKFGPAMTDGAPYQHRRHGETPFMA
jgi:hypothetical protein